MRKRCNHRYKGLYGRYIPRLRKTKIKGEWWLATDYQCQIKGCNHWKLAHFLHKLPKKKEDKKQ